MSRPLSALVFVGLSLTLAGCEDPSEGACGTTDAGVEVFANLPKGGVDGITTDAVITGTSTHRDNAAVRKLWITIEDPTTGDLAVKVPVEKTSANFETWRVSLPIELLRDYADSDHRVALQAEVSEVCGTAPPVAIGSLHLDPEAGIEIDNLKLEVQYPGNPEALPADGSLKGLLVVSADVKATGASVMITGEALTFPDLGSATVKLVSMGEQAQAVVQIKSQVAGSKLAIVTARDAIAQTIIHVVGAPRIAPLSWSLLAGASVPLTVASEGDATIKLTCQATPSATVKATSAGIDLSTTPGGSDIDNDSRLDIVVTADLAAAPGDSVTLVCTDELGQVGQAATVTVQ